jgi:hypothetical protein
MAASPYASAVTPSISSSINCSKTLSLITVAANRLFSISSECAGCRSEAAARLVLVDHRRSVFSSPMSFPFSATPSSFQRLAGLPKTLSKVYFRLHKPLSTRYALANPHLEECLLA